MTELLASYWVVIVLAVIALAAVGLFVGRSRARVSLSHEEAPGALDRASPAPTLARAVPTAVEAEPASAGSDAFPAAASVAAAAPSAPLPADLAIAPAVGAPDDLQKMKGVGPKLATLLSSLGITRFDQIAAWGPDEIAAVDARLGAFTGRITRDDWIAQAGLLAAGDTAGFEARFGALGSGR